MWQGKQRRAAHSNVATALRALKWLSGAKAMQNDAATLQCPNDLCKAANCQTDQICQRCGTPLIKRYLWVVGDGIEADKFGVLVGAKYLLIGDLVGDRYLLKSDQIFLDTKPGLAPEMPSLEISNAVKPYLKLVPYRLQIPQVYGLLRQSEQTAKEILLLEQAPIYTDAVSLEGQLMPELTAAWKNATSMRQLNWLWQMATLWQPLSSEGVASSLLDPQLLRVEGSLVRLLQLRLDLTHTPDLSQLGQMWKSQLVDGAQQVIAELLEQLCQRLIQGEVRSSQQLVTILDRGLTETGRSQARTLIIGMCTDKGPSRQRNEDACYPPSGTTITKPPERKALAIVCDGIGGHEGGNIASNLAIEMIQQQVQQMPLDNADLEPTTLIDDLESSACAANDRISQRNDNEQRSGRQRMGTTLVMALARAHEIYITHVGDSRAYWITRTGCHQVTLDDDVASREVRLGYTFYHDALQQAYSGSLVQALGMSSSASLNPTVQRFVLDEDCVFLLCSDGLSDYDRVEQCWKTEILPIFDGIDVGNTVARLVELANTQNGHDNVTVGLVYCQVKSFEPESKLSASLADLATISLLCGSPPAGTISKNPETIESPASAAFSTPDMHLFQSRRSSRRGLIPVFLGLFLLLILSGGVLVYSGLLLGYWKLYMPVRPTTAGSSPLEAQSPTRVPPGAKTPVVNPSMSELTTPVAPDPTVEGESH